MKTDAVAPYNPSLYDLEESLLWAFQQITEAQASGVEPSDEVMDLIHAYAGAAPAKRDRCAQFLRHLESQEDAINAEVKRLQLKAIRIAAAKERFEGYVLAVMDRVGMKRLEGTTYTFTAKNNPPSVVVDDPAQVPAEFMRQKPAPPAEPDRIAIKKRLQSGAEVPGARLVTGKRRLEVA